MLSFLTSKTRPGCLYPSGLDLVEKYTDPSNGRRFMVKLTPKGKAILSAIKEIIYD
jgi:predicted transcriptional regulator|tara:strand:+ start:180 stop:347 length:168 start_codon:yes stop_codon:yes gene_type:complete